MLLEFESCLETSRARVAPVNRTRQNPSGTNLSEHVYSSSSIKTRTRYTLDATRREHDIIRLDELSSVIRLERHTANDSSSGRIINRVRVVMLDELREP